MFLKFNERGLTLVELVLSILLVNVVILTGLSMEMGMRKLFTGTDFTSELNNEGTALMALVVKKINTGIGAQAIDALAYPNTYKPYVALAKADGTAWAIRQDTNGNGIAELSPLVDRHCAFRYFSAGVNRGQVAYYSDVANVDGVPTLILTTHALGFTIGAPTVEGCSLVTLDLRRDILSAVSAANPAVSFVTKAQYLCTSFS